MKIFNEKNRKTGQQSTVIMYIGAWQEYRLANAFTQPSDQRHAQLTQFYSKWQRLCDEQGEQAATKALIFDPLFASVAGETQAASKNHQVYQLEQEGKQGWRLGQGGGNNIVTGRGRSAGHVRPRGQQFVRQGVRTVQKRKENYLAAQRGGSSRSSSSSSSSDSGMRLAPTSANSSGAENIPPFFRTSISPSTSITERVIVANPNRYVGATAAATTTTTNATKLSSAGERQRNSPLRTVNTQLQTPELYQQYEVQHQQDYEEEFMQRVQTQQEQQQDNVSHMLPQVALPVPQILQQEVASSSLQVFAEQRQHSDGTPPLSPVRTATPGGSRLRPDSSGPLSPQVWEQEVDDLLKWTEDLENGSDPLDQSWGALGDSGPLELGGSSSPKGEE